MLPDVRPWRHGADAARPQRQRAPGPTVPEPSERGVTRGREAQPPFASYCPLGIDDGGTIPLIRMYVTRLP